MKTIVFLRSFPSSHHLSQTKTKSDASISHPYHEQYLKISQCKGGRGEGGGVEDRNDTTRRRHTVDGAKAPHRDGCCSAGARLVTLVGLLTVADKVDRCERRRRELRTQEGRQDGRRSGCRFNKTRTFFSNVYIRDGAKNLSRHCQAGRH